MIGSYRQREEDGVFSGGAESGGSADKAGNGEEGTGEVGKGNVGEGEVGKGEVGKGEVGEGGTGKRSVDSIKTLPCQANARSFVVRHRNLRSEIGALAL